MRRGSLDGRMEWNRAGRSDIDSLVGISFIIMWAVSNEW